MGWHWISKGKHDHEVGSSSDRRRSSSFALPAPPSLPAPPAPPAFQIAPPTAGQRDRPYIHVDVCRRYCEIGTPLPWGDVHLLNNWHLSADRVPITTVPVSGRARRAEINRPRTRLPPDLLEDARYAMGSPLWDMWLRDEHDQIRREYYFSELH
ncbi:uncharacterized protein [Aegilops tauschii subsp. strangulata]|uniref:uncharacterized protein n=1 Tax=Aegilops tauschii subsp. strangulata TaxID=200361 RepID=UPI003CC8DBF9